VTSSWSFLSTLIKLCSLWINMASGSCVMYAVRRTRHVNGIRRPKFVVGGLGQCFEFINSSSPCFSDQCILLLFLLFFYCTNQMHHTRHIWIVKGTAPPRFTKNTPSSKSMACQYYVKSALDVLYTFERIFTLKILFI